MTNHTYPAELPIAPLATAPSATVTVPGSKSITNRALVLAALTNPHSPTLFGCLQSEDTEVMIAALRNLGYEVYEGWSESPPQVTVVAPARMPDTADLFLANSGTSIRFLTAMVSLGHGRYRLDGVSRMRERPIQELLDALVQLGVDARSESGTGCPPVIVVTNGIRGGRAVVKAERSSQYLSALLMAAPFAAGDTTVEVEGPLVSEPYIEMTLGMLRDFQCEVSVEGGRVFHVKRYNHRPLPGRYDIEPDASAASYFYAAAAITGGTVCVADLPATSIQGDIHFVDVLEQMGCRVVRAHSGITVHGGPLRGVDVDMNAISDTVMTLAAVAVFADGPTTIRNVGHIRHKETDRIAAVATELRKLGAEVEERADGLTITPRPLTGCAVDTYKDHRMAMSLALVGLKVPGVVIRDPGCVAKTYPGFWQDLEKLRG